MRRPFSLAREIAPKLLELTQSLAGGSFADVKPPNDFFHRQGSRRRKEEPVNRSIRARVAKQIRQIREDVDKFTLQGGLGNTPELPKIANSRTG